MRCRVSEDLNSYYNDEEGNGYKGPDDNDCMVELQIARGLEKRDRNMEETYDICMNILDLIDNSEFDYYDEEALKLQKTFEKLYQQLLSRTKDE